MTRAVDTQTRCMVETDELRRALQRELDNIYGAPKRIVELVRRASPYSSSYTMEELDVRLEDAGALQLMFKNLSWQAIIEDARHVKPQLIYDPLREIETYRRILAPARLSTPAFYGAHADADASCYWLFIERIEGRKMRHVGEFDVWLEVARWLARMHSRFAGEVDSLARRQPHLLNYGSDFYRLWMRRARSLLSHREATEKGPRQATETEAAESIEQIAARYEKVVARLVSLPATFVHGDFFASNILVEEGAGKLRVCPVDWEMAGTGTGLIDLAALTAGSWEAEQRNALEMAYYHALTPHDRWPPTRDEFLDALDCCRLHMAVQLLGWAAKWSPPQDEAQDWLGEARRLMRKLRLS